MSLAPGLYLVATPIGTADDITLRALTVLREADVLAAEDTRRTRKLMEIHGLPLARRRMVAYHDHSAPAVRDGLVAALKAGQSVAYATDAGTPLVADPGYRLTQDAIAADVPVHPIPGASAVLTALSVAGLPTDRFFFAGFLPPRHGARRAALQDVAAVPGTLVFYEAPSRLAAALADMAAVLGNRDAAVCRELTKKFEEVRRAPLATLAAAYADAPPKGEVVVVVAPPGAAETTAADLDDALTAALQANSVRDAAQIVAAATGLPRKTVYARALALSRP